MFLSLLIAILQLVRTVPTTFATTFPCVDMCGDSLVNGFLVVWIFVLEFSCLDCFQMCNVDVLLDLRHLVVRIPIDFRFADCINI